MSRQNPKPPPKGGTERAQGGKSKPERLAEGPGESQGGRAPTATGTQARLVNAARELFLERGYEAVSIADILEKSGVNSGSLYYFFRTKQELLLAVLDWYLDNLHPEVINPAKAAEADPIRQVFAVMEGYRRLLTLTGCRIGCPIGNLALEMSEKSEAVREKIARNFENWRAAIREMLLAGRDRLPASTDCDALATFILTVMEGGVMQARAHRSLHPFEQSVKLLRDYVDRLLAGASKKKEEEE